MKDPTPALDALQRLITEARKNHAFHASQPVPQPSLQTQLAKRELDTLLTVQKLFHA